MVRNFDRSVNRIGVMGHYVGNSNHVDSNRRSWENSLLAYHRQSRAIDEESQENALLTHHHQSRAIDEESRRYKEARRELALSKLFRKTDCICRRCNRKEEPEEFADSDWDNTDSQDEESENPNVVRDPDDEPEKLSTAMIRAVKAGPHEALLCMRVQAIERDRQWKKLSNPDTDPRVPREA